MEESVFVLRREINTSQICVGFPSFLYDEPISYTKEYCEENKFAQKNFFVEWKQGAERLQPCKMGYCNTSQEAGGIRYQETQPPKLLSIAKMVMEVLC